MALKGNHIGSVYIKVRPDAKNFRRDTQRQVGRDPIEVEVEVRPEDERRLADDVNRMARNAEGKARIKFEPDYAGIQGAKRRVERMLRDLGSHEIDLELNTDALKSARDDLEEMLGEGVETTVRYTEDEQGYHEVLEHIAEIRRQKAEVEVTFETDDESLDALESEIQRKLSDFHVQNPAELIYGDGESVRRVIDSITAELERLDAMETDIDVDHSEVNKAREQLEKLRRAAEDVQAQTGKVVPFRPLTDPAFYAVTEAQLDRLARDRWVTFRTRVAGRLGRNLQGAFMSLAGINQIRDMVEQIEHAVTHFDEIAVAAGNMGAAIGTAASVGTVALGAILTTLRDIAEGFQLAAMGPTVLLSAYSGFATWRAITKDFSAALMGIPGVLEKMPPAAQQGVKAIQALQAATEDVVQNNFWAEMSDEIVRFTKQVGPTVTSAMGAVSAEFGRAISGMLDHLNELVKDGTLEQFARDNAELYHDLADAAQPAFEGLMNMAQAGSKYLPRMGDWIERMAHGFKDFADEAVRSGRFDVWVMNGVNAFRDLGRVVVDTSKILGNFADIFDSLSIGGLHEMADGLQRVEQFTASAGFQQRMRTIFDGAKEGAAGAARGFGDLMKVLYDLDEEVANLLADTGNLAGAMMTTLSSAIGQPTLYRGLRDLFDGMTDFVDRATPGFEALARVIGNVATVGGEVARQIAPGMNLTIGLIDGIIERLSGPLVASVDPLTRVFENITAMSSGPLLLMANAASGLLTAFAGLPGPVQSLVVGLAAATRLMGPLKAGFMQVRDYATNMFAGSTMGPRLNFQRQLLLPFQHAVDEGRHILRNGGTKMQAVWGGVTDGLVRTAQTAGRGISRAFSGLMGALGGPWGAALMAGVALLGHWAGAQADAKANTDALTEAIIAQADGAEGALRKQIFDLLKEDARAFSEMGGNIRAVIDEIEGGNIDKVAKDFDYLRSVMEDMEDGDWTDSTTWARATEVARQYGVELGAMGPKGLEALRGLNQFGEGLRTLSPELQQAYQDAQMTGDAMADIEKAVPEGNWSSNFELLADAVKRFGDEADTAEGRARGLGDAMRILAGNGARDADNLRQSAGTLMENVQKELEAAAKEGINWGSVFDDSGKWDVVNSSAARQMRDVATNAATAFEEELMAIQIDLESGLISEAEAAKQFDAVYAKAESFGSEVVKTMGLSGTEAGKQLAANIDREMAHITEENFKATVEMDSLDAEADIKALRDAGLALSREQYEFLVGADAEGAYTAVQRAQGLGEHFALQAYMAMLDGDTEGMQNAYLTALNMGIMWNGQTWEAALDATGQPTAEAIEWARGLGFTWSGEVFEADIDADPAGAKKGAEDATRAVNGVPDGDVDIDADPSGAVGGARTATGAIKGVPDRDALVRAIVEGLGGVNNLKSAIDRLQNKTVTIAARVKNGIGSLMNTVFGGGAADGAMTGTRFRKKPFALQAFADGGINYTTKPTSAHIAPAGSYTMFAEKETGGEAYIPLSSAKRSRSLAIWREVGKRFGVYADGGINGGSISNSSAYTINVARGGATGDDIAQALTHHALKTRR